MATEHEVGAGAPRPNSRPVFISHSGDDRTIAEKVCKLLELEGVDCWIALRDVEPGPNRGEQILGAIKSAPTIVLILSANANDSIFVAMEIERAVSMRKIVFVLRIDDVMPSPVLELFVSRSRWIDARTLPLEAGVHVLAEAICGRESFPASPE